MTHILTVFFALLVGTFSGTLAGGALALWLLRHGRADAVPAADALPVDPDTDEQIKRAASRWAEAHGRPDAAHLIADKLRLVYNLNRRRQRRPERRW